MVEYLKRREEIDQDRPKGVPMFEKLTEFIPRFQGRSVGDWIIDEENDGTFKNPKQMPFVSYDRSVHEFLNAVYDFIDEHDEMDLTNYDQILRGVDVEDVSKLDSIQIMALIVEIVRQDRFYEGALLDCIKSGKITEWLKHLEVIDQNS